MKIKPRRPYDDNQPDGYMESDRDYVENNLEACVFLLDEALASGRNNTLLAHRGVALLAIATAVGLKPNAKPREIVDAVKALAARAQPKDQP